MTHGFIERLLSEYEQRPIAARELNTFLRNILNTRGTVADPDDEDGSFRAYDLPAIDGWDITIHDRIDEAQAACLPLSDNFHVFDPIGISFFYSPDHEPDGAFNEPVGFILVGSNVVFVDGAQLDAKDITSLYTDLHELLGQ